MEKKKKKSKKAQEEDETEELKGIKKMHDQMNNKVTIPAS